MYSIWCTTVSRPNVMLRWIVQYMMYYSVKTKWDVTLNCTVYDVLQCQDQMRCYFELYSIWCTTVSRSNEMLLWIVQYMMYYSVKTKWDVTLNCTVYDVLQYQDKSLIISIFNILILWNSENMYNFISTQWQQYAASNNVSFGCFTITFLHAYPRAPSVVIYALPSVWCLDGCCWFTSEYCFF